MRRAAGFMLAVTLMAGVAGTAHADVDRGDRGQEVVEVQYQLRALGYTLAVDGTFGAQTERVVRTWQRVNGLLPDGIVGPVTSESLARAVRVAPPAPSGPSEPTFASLCEEMSWYRQQAGLPEVFDRIGVRESGCQNDAKPTSVTARRYRGWWSVGVMHIYNVVYGPGAAACGIDHESDYYGTSPSQKRASACFAKVLYDNSGMQPWATN
jgi:hypothetical protein